MKLLKKSLSLLLVLCMLLSFVPMNVFAAETGDETQEGTFYKIVHLDVARKYYSPEVIMDYIDDMAELGYNQLQLYLGDNQGFRFMLNDTSVTTSYGTYKLDEGIVNSGYVQDYAAGDSFYRPSAEYDQNEKYYLTEAEMDAIIDYATPKGIEIVPSINMPGHMGAILQNMPESWHYTHTNGQVSGSTMNLDNDEAVAFVKALLQKYVDYFAGKGCNFFNIGSDEFGYDIGMRGNVPAAVQAKVVTFMNDCAKIITDKGMTPRAFNDFFVVGNGLTTDFEIYMWNGGNAKELQAAGYQIINTSDMYYYAVGSKHYSSEEKGIVKDTALFDPMVIEVNGGSSTTLTTPPVGAMVCIWSDRGYEGNDATADVASDGGVSVYEHTKNHIAGFAEALNGSSSTEPSSDHTYELVLGSTDNNSVTVTLEGTYTTNDLTGLTGDAVIPSAAPTAGGLSSSPLTNENLGTGTKIVIGTATTNADNTTTYKLLKIDGSALTTTSSASDATVWTITVTNESNFKLHSEKDGYYLAGDNSDWEKKNPLKLIATDPGFAWLLEDNVLKMQSYPNAYVNLAATTPSSSSTKTEVYTYAYTTGQTTFTFTADKVGTTTFTLNGETYTINVVEEATHPTITYPCATSGHSGGIATCTHGKYCVSCGEIYDTATDPNVHLNEHTSGIAQEPDENYHYGVTTICAGCSAVLSPGSKEEHYGGTATCASGKICSSCGYVYTDVDISNHVGGTKVIKEKSPTVSEDGYTGDTVCKSCGYVYKKGTVIPKLESENMVDLVVVEHGSKTVTVYDAAAPDVSTTDETRLDKSIATYDEPAFIPGTPTIYPELTTVVADGETPFLIKSGDNYLSVNGTSMTAETDSTKAAQWFMNADGHIYTDFTGSRLYLYHEYWHDGKLALDGGNKSVWTYDATANSFSTVIAENQGGGTNTPGTYTLVYNNGWTDQISPTTGIANAWTTGAAKIPSETTITFRGITPGTTYVTIGGIDYRIRVLEDVIDGQTIEIGYFITNRGVKADPTINPDAFASNEPFYDYSSDKPRSFTISATDTGYNVDTDTVDSVHSALGIAIDEIGNPKPADSTAEGTVTNNVFPYYGVSSDNKNVAYGYSMMLPAGKTQGRWGETSDRETDYSTSNERSYYIRFWGGEWQVADIDRTNWVTVNTGDVAEERNMLAAYYLQETDVTEEIIVSTYVQDWGLVGKTPSTGTYSNWVLLDFAVRFSDGVRDPALNKYPQENKTVLYHSVEDQSDPELVEIQTDAEGKEISRTREVRMMEGLETGIYEVYMVTIKANNDDPSVTLKDTATSGYQYDGTEYVVWLESEDTAYDTSTIMVHPDDFVDADGDGVDDNGVTDGYYSIKYGDETWGNPSFDGVKIHNYQGMLITYYVRAKSQESNLKVWYQVDDDGNGNRIENKEGDEIQGIDIYEYDIVPSIDEHGSVNYFDPGFDTDVLSADGLKNNTVINSTGTPQTVTSILTTMMEVPEEYRSGEYQFTGEILYGYHDANGAKHFISRATLDAMIKEGNTPDISDVVLYYNHSAVGQIHYVPVDFGSPVKIDIDFFAHHSSIENGSYAEDVAGYIDSLELKYGDISYVEDDENGDYLVYTPTSVLHAEENIFTVTIKGSNNESGEVHSIVFVPATTVYYEETFITLTGSWTLAADTGYSDDYQQCLCYNEERPGYDAHNYGYDARYVSQGISASDGTFAKTKNGSDLGKFQFTGTGIEIYANCTPSSGRAFITIYNSKEALVKMYMVDTIMKNGEIENGFTSSQKVNAYNVPIVSQLGLPYDHYTVRISYIATNEERDEISIDGFRVYGTMIDNDKLASTDVTAGQVYAKHSERNPSFVEMRDMILAHVKIPETYDGVYAHVVAQEVMSQVYSTTSGNAPYAVILDGTTQNTTDEDIIVDLIDNGPKNEVYLHPGQTIVFNYSADFLGQIGLKALDAKVEYTISTGGNKIKDNADLNTSTDMYYPIGVGKDGTVTITNNSGGILAVTKLKGNLERGQVANANLINVIDAKALTSALVALGFAETPVEDVPDVTEPEVTEPEVTEPEATEPEETEPEVTTPDVEFVGASLSLKGDIGLNFYVKLSDAILADEDAYMQFIVGGNTKKVPLTDGILDESDGSYRFSVALNAKNMGDAVVAQVFNEDGAVGDSKTLSIKDYADYVIKNSNKGQLVKLMKAMLNYGAAAQIEFNYNIDNLVNADLDDADKTKPGKADVDAFEHTLSGEEEGITVTSASLLLQSETKIRIYFKLAEGKTIDDYTFSVDGETFVPVLAEGGEYYIEKANVAAKDLDSVYEFQMGGLTLTYSGMSYINQVQKQGGEDVDLQKLAKTLYEYCQAANVYFG